MVVVRWNGWGEESTTLEVPPQALHLLQKILGEGIPFSDYSKEAFYEKIPPSRLSAHPKISVAPADRLLHAHGQSLPDWIALRSGTLLRFPDGVAYPETREELQEIFSLALKQNWIVIPYGGGTSVVGHLTVPEEERPVLSLSLERMTKLLALDEYNLLATFEAGVRGPELESQLQAKGYTLGHFPQSFEYSTLGGWVVTRSSGQQSLYYGRIEQLFVAGELLTPQGIFSITPCPASAAGPDLRHLVLGSEGRLGVLTQATVKISPQPEAHDVYAFFFSNWNAGLEAVHSIAQRRLPLSMVRLSNEDETQTQLLLAGHEKQIRLLKRYLSLRGLDPEHLCLCLIGITGTKKEVAQTRRTLFSLLRKTSGISTGKVIGEGWKKNRFRTPYLRNTLWNIGYAIDTLETAVTWEKVTPAMEKIQRVIREGLSSWNEPVYVFSHLSHIYTQGSSIYTTFLFRLASSPEENLLRWKTLKNAASQAIVEVGGTISHQHGVGIDHKPYLLAEKSAIGLQMLGSVFSQIDPKEQMNPQKLI